MLHPLGALIGGPLDVIAMEKLSRPSSVDTGALGKPGWQLPAQKPKRIGPPVTLKSGCLPSGVPLG